jgi:lipoate-protein ligase A
MRNNIPCQIKTIRQKNVAAVRSPVCFESTSIGEINHDGMKLVGSARKRWKDYFLQPGAIPFSIDVDLITSVFDACPFHPQEPERNKPRL